MRSSLTVVLLLLVAAMVTGASPAPVGKWTNAQRLARGLPPLPAKFGRQLPGHVEARDPTPAFGAKRSAPSSKPPSPPVAPVFTGRIEVRASNGSLGFVQNSASGIAGINFDGKEEDDLHVTTSGPGPYDLVATGQNFTGSSFIGIAASNTTELGPGLSSVANFTNVDQTAVNAIVGPTTAVGSESAVWFVNSTTQELTAVFVNPDGSEPTTIIAYSNTTNTLFFVGDIVAYNAAHVDAPATNVTFFIVDT